MTSRAARPPTCPRRRRPPAAPSSYRTSLRSRAWRPPGRQRWKADDTYAFDRSEDPRADLLDRHPAADGRRGRCTSGTSSPTPTPTWSPASSGCAARRSSTRWAGTTTACPPSAGCRTTSACAATRRCPTTRTSRRRRSRTRSGRCRSAGRTSSSCASGSSRRTSRPSSRCGARSACRSTGSRPTRRSASGRGRSSQRAFLRNFARGEAYLQEAPTLWDVTFQTAVAQAELEAREYAGAYHRVAFHGADGPGPHRDHPARADPGRRRADRPPRRRALPAAVRHDGDLAGVRRRDPGARAPGGRARQGRRHRDVLHVRRPHRRAVVARAAAAGAHRHRPRRPAAPRDAASGWRTSRPRRRTPSSPARPRSAPARRWSGCCASPATSTASRRRRSG